MGSMCITINLIVHTQGFSKDEEQTKDDLDIYSDPGVEDTHYYSALAGDRSSPTPIRGNNYNNLGDQGLAIQALQIQTKQIKKKFWIVSLALCVTAVVSLGLLFRAVSTIPSASTTDKEQLSKIQAELANRKGNG
eukprot:TRINITY_DN17375_c0_g1_i1.p1 TRINITY_DN17375_c0_g1~~TRINITY_DN17375_c0_g1_i1.p1  ORF type:complete len:147 (-),score=49.75 TRINITY_DN17375_c0_g1_i1:79-483(-)